MPKAGYCRSCGSNVWLAPEGACPNGHPSGDVEGVYEASLPSAPEPLPARRRASRKWWVIGALAAVLLLGGACAGVVALLTPTAQSAGEIADEWKQTLATDYPGWDVVGWHWSSFSGSGGSSTTYTFAVVPPGREFAVPVVYESQDDSEFESADLVMREGCEFPERSEALLDYLEDNYVDQDKSMTAMRCEQDGSVTVEWRRVSRILFFTSSVGSFDEIAWDEEGQEYVHSWSP